MEVKIQIPDNCELIKDGDTYIVKKKKQEPPRSWKEFCENYPIKKGESYIMPGSDSIFTASTYDSGTRLSKVWCTSEEEARAFLALMQLRQLRKAWVGDWEPSFEEPHAVIFFYERREIKVDYGLWALNYALSFPIEEMAEDFLNCFRDLCETAKILL